MSERLDILTDLETGIWRDNFRLSAEDGILLSGAENWSITKRTLRGGVSNGIDVINIDNGVLSVDVLPTRGMGLWRGLHRGNRLGWGSPARHPVHPAFVNAVDQQGLGWLTGFNEWMCRCGLSSLGEPGLDVVDNRAGPRRESRVSLHGRIANTPCHHVSVGVNDEDLGTLMVRGIMEEAWLYGPKLSLVSTLQTVTGSSSLLIADEVTNLSNEPAELQLLYHTNVGTPLLEQGARLVAAVEEVAPYDQHSMRTVDSWDLFDGPTPGYTQRCYFMQPIPDEEGFANVLLHNRARDQGIGLVFNTRVLPYFTVWKNLQGEGDGYVSGLEPATCFPNLISFERDRQRVIVLPPGASYRTSLEIHVYHGTTEVIAAEKAIHRQIKHEPTLHRCIHAQYSPVDAMKT